MSGFWTDAEVRAALGLAGAEPQSYAAVSTDTRTLGEGSLFVALRGERFDAHDYLAQAAERGARGAVVERVPEGAPSSLTYYRVEDTRVALGRLARHYRRSLNARVCAVVGSNGKTTTKELARAVLATRYRVHATEGNLNNLVGTPLTLLAAPADAEALVIEVGTNSPGEVERLGRIVEPDVAIITAIAEEHLEGLGNLEGVLREETSILGTLSSEGVALVGDEPPELAERARLLCDRVRVAGWSSAADPALRAERVELDDEGRVRFEWQGHAVRLALRGRPNARNALLALGLGLEWGVDVDAAVEALTHAQPPKMRAELHRYGGLTVIADCYNANPASVDAAVDLLVALPRGGARVAVLGTMRELGNASEELHRRTAEAVAEAEVDVIVATGEFARAFGPLAEQLGDRLIAAEDPLDAYVPLAARLTGREVVLLKGSRGVALERLLPHFEKDWGQSAAPLRTDGEARAGGQAATAAGGE